jgi:hypothetical protein
MRTLRAITFPEFERGGSLGVYAGPGSSLGEPGYQGRTERPPPIGWTPNPQAYDPFNTYRGVDPFSGQPIQRKTSLPVPLVASATGKSARGYATDAAFGGHATDVPPEISDTGADTGGSVLIGTVVRDGIKYNRFADIGGYVYEAFADPKADGSTSTGSTAPGVTRSNPRQTGQPPPSPPATVPPAPETGVPTDPETIVTDTLPPTPPTPPRPEAPTRGPAGLPPDRPGPTGSPAWPSAPPVPPSQGAIPGWTRQASGAAPGDRRGPMPIVTGRGTGHRAVRDFVSFDRLRDFVWFDRESSDRAQRRIDRERREREIEQRLETARADDERRRQEEYRADSSFRLDWYLYGQPTYKPLSEVVAGTVPFGPPAGLLESAASRALTIHQAAGGLVKYRNLNPTVVLDTAEGAVLVSRGPTRQLTLPQRAVLRPGETMIRMRPDTGVGRIDRIHPDIRVLVHAHRTGLTPRALAVEGQAFCPLCVETIEAFGGELITPSGAVFPFP